MISTFIRDPAYEETYLCLYGPGACGRLCVCVCVCVCVCACVCVRVLYRNILVSVYMHLREYICIYTDVMVVISVRWFVYNCIHLVFVRCVNIQIFLLSVYERSCACVCVCKKYSQARARGCYE